MDPEQVAGHLLKKQLLDPHWEKKAAEVMALERATLYGLVIYSNRRVNFGQRRPARRRARSSSARRWSAASGTRKLPFLAHNHKLVAQVEELEHKSRRQDVLVDDELIFAFYDQQLPPRRVQRRQLRALVSRRSRSASRDLLKLTRDELMRHEAAGITTEAFPEDACAWAASIAPRATCTSPATPGRRHGDACRCSC